MAELNDYYKKKKEEYDKKNPPSESVIVQPGTQYKGDTPQEYYTEQSTKRAEEAAKIEAEKKAAENKPVGYQEYETVTDERGRTYSRPKPYSNLTDETKRSMGFNLDKSPAQEARNKFEEITQKPYAQASKPAQATQLTPEQKQAYGIEKPTLPQAKQAPPVQPPQKQFGGVSISAAPKPQWYDTPKRFISSSWESFWNPSEQTGETLRTGNPEEVAGALFGVVGSVYGSSKTAATKVGTTVGSKFLQFLSVFKPGKTALKVGAGLIASDIALYPFAQQSEQGKQLYGTYTNLQLAGAEIFFTVKAGKAAYSAIASAPAVQNIAKWLSASKAGKKALDIFTYTKTINVGKQAFAVAPFATAANIGLGVGTYNVAYGAYNIFAQPESGVDKKEIKRLAAMGYERGAGAFGGEQQYKERVRDYYIAQGLSPEQANKRATALLMSSEARPFQVETEAEKTALERLKPGTDIIGSITDSTNQFLYTNFDFFRVARRSQNIAGIPNPFYTAGQRRAELSPAYEYSQAFGLSQGKQQALIADVEKEMYARDFALIGSNVAVNTYSEVLGQTLIYPNVFKQMAKNKVVVKSDFGGRARLALTGLSTAPLGFAEGAAGETTRQQAFGEEVDFNRIMGMGGFGALSSTAIQGALFATTPIKAKQTGRAQKIIQIGSYVTDPYEYIGDVAAENLVIPKMQKLSGVEFDRPIFIKRGESLEFGIATGKQPIMPRFRTFTQTSTQAQTKGNINIFSEIDKTPVKDLNNIFSQNVGVKIDKTTTQSRVPIMPEIPEPISNQNENINNIFNNPYTQTQTNVFSNVAVATPMFRIPPPMPLAIPGYGQGYGAGISAKERKAYKNELAQSRQLMNELVGVQIYAPIKKATKKRKKGKRK